MVDPLPFDIYLVNVPLNESRYPRPAVVVRAVTADFAEVLQISAAMDLYDPSTHFLIRRTDAAFPQTGLKFGSFIASTELVKVPLELFVKRLGCLDGDLARDFKTWFGL